MTERHYIIQCASAQMPSTCWGRYRRIAVLEVEPGIDRVSMISERARGCIRVVRTWERLHCGKTERDAYSRAWREAEQLIEQLKAGAA